MENLVKYEIFILLLMWVQGAFAQQVRVESPVRFLALGDSYTLFQSLSTWRPTSCTPAV